MYRNKPWRNQKLATAAITSNFGQKQLLEICIFQATIENCKSFLTMNWEASAPMSSNKIARDSTLNLLRFQQGELQQQQQHLRRARCIIQTWSELHCCIMDQAKKFKIPINPTFDTTMRMMQLRDQETPAVSCLQQLDFFYSLRRHAAVLLLHLKKTCGSLQRFFFSCSLLRPPYILQPLRQCDQAQ
jgi:hypothetical protein